MLSHCPVHSLSHKEKWSASKIFIPKLFPFKESSYAMLLISLNFSYIVALVFKVII